jgi:hypothetical protein
MEPLLLIIHSCDCDFCNLVSQFRLDKIMSNKMIFARCQVSPGIFDSEFYVVIGDTSAFVNRSNVKVQATPKEGHQVEGEVLVYLVDEESGKMLVELPGQAVVGGLRTWISRDTLAA